MSVVTYLKSRVLLDLKFGVGNQSYVMGKMGSHKTQA